MKSRSNFNILHCAAYHGWLDVVKQLIIEHRFKPDCEDDDGNTPLSKARSNGKQIVVDYLETVTLTGTFVIYFSLRNYLSKLACNIICRLDPKFPICRYI